MKKSPSRKNAGRTKKIKDVKRELTNEIKALGLLEKRLSREPDREAIKALAMLRDTLGKISSEVPRHFNLLDMIRRVLMAHDLLFLSRQVTYHIAANAEIPDIWADADQIQIVFTRLIEHIVRRAPRGGRIAVGFKQFAIRGNPGIELNISCPDKGLAESNSRDFIGNLFKEETDDISGVSLSECRRIATREQGQLWVDFLKPHQPVYHLAIPATEQGTKSEPAAQQTFKYDISINNFANVRKRFGIKKSLNLMSQIEHCIKSLVRYPMDMVITMGDKGVVTTIYETQRGSAQSVASRISARLGAEHFKIGKYPVDVAFSYHLSPLSSIAPSSNKETSRKNS